MKEFRVQADAFKGVSEGECDVDHISRVKADEMSCFVSSPLRMRKPSGKFQRAFDRLNRI